MPVELPRFLRDTIQAKPYQLDGCLLNPFPRNFFKLCEIPQET